MTVTVASFRTDFTEFADGSKFPNDTISFWLTIAQRMVNASRWTTMTDLGVELFTAHNVVLERKAQAAAETGAIPGETFGVVNSKSVDKVSVGYDAGLGIEEGAGHWNLTIYGTRFIKISRMFGAGPVQIGGGCASDPLASYNAWPGPFPNQSF